MTAPRYLPPPEPEVLARLQQWATARDNVRTMILTSSRANPRRAPDLLSDYDVELFVRDVAPFAADDSWLAAFGPIIVRWPLHPGATGDEKWLTRLVLFENGIRFDFQITTLPPSASKNLDSGYRVLVDKDRLATRLPAPRYDHFHVKRPSPEAFADRLNAFWWDIVYVPKALWRGELNLARSMLEAIRVEKLQPLIEWSIGSDHDWSVNSGVFGRWFHLYLDDATWDAYLQTFAGASATSHWQALFATMAFVRTQGLTLARRLGYPYPEATDQKVTAYIEWIHGLEPRPPF